MEDQLKGEFMFSNLSDAKGPYSAFKVRNVNKILTPEELNKMSEMIASEGNLELQYEDNFNEDLYSTLTNLKFAGFVNVTVSNKTITATKREWSKKKKTNPWKSLKENDNGKAVLIEDELIDPLDDYQKFSKAEDCITKPKACKNCNCGRAEKEAKKEIDPNFKPSCGKCYLGDAFRCAGCPYRGMPAFEAGDKVEFATTDVISTSSLEQELSQVNVKGNKIKIDL